MSQPVDTIVDKSIGCSVRPASRRLVALTPRRPASLTPRRPAACPRDPSSLDSAHKARSVGRGGLACPRDRSVIARKRSDRSNPENQTPGSPRLRLAMTEKTHVATPHHAVSRTRHRCMAGFTLLEIMLVIGVIAVLVVLGLRFTQGEMKRSQVEHAGQELQSVMQAAIYYHSINHQWPDENSASSCSSEAADGKFAQYYLPKNSEGSEEKSIYGTYYCWQQHNSDGSDYENAALFDVYLSVKGSHACQVAKKIAGTVPNAHAVAELGGDSSAKCGDERDYFVRAQVVPSAQSVSDHSGQSFRGLGQCVPETAPTCDDDASFAASTVTCCHVSGSNPTQYKIHFPACEPGQTQKIVYLPAFITMMNSKGKASNTPLQMFDRDYVHTAVDASADPTANRISNPEPSCVLDSDSNQLVCSLTVGVGVKSQNSGVIDTVNSSASSGVSAAYSAGSVGAVYVASCMDDQ